MYTDVSVEKGIAEVVLDHPPVNAFDSRGWEHLAELFTSLGRDEAVRWWTVARTLWWGLGLARQAQVFMNGDANSIVLAASGRRVVELEYDLLRLMED